MCINPKPRTGWVELRGTEHTYLHAHGAASGKNNIGLIDDNTAQTLGAGKIAQMKGAGVEGHIIVDALAKHSTTFTAKTEFAQEKYLRKKQKK